MSNGSETAAKSELYTPSEEVIANANVPDYLALRKQVWTIPSPFGTRAPRN